MNTQADIVYNILKDSTIVRSREFTQKGVDTKTISRMVVEGKIIRIARGLYVSHDYIPGTHHSLIQSSIMIENGIICLLSALSYYEIGTQNPSLVWVALSRTARKPKVDTTPVQFVRLSEGAFKEGVSEIFIDNKKIHIYNIPKTIADCFKFRNKIGLDVAIEALRDVLENKKATVEEILHYSEICRVRKIITPYMESLV